MIVNIIGVALLLTWLGVLLVGCVVVSVEEAQGFYYESIMAAVLTLTWEGRSLKYPIDYALLILQHQLDRVYVYFLRPLTLLLWYVFYEEDIRIVLKEKCEQFQDLRKVEYKWLNYSL